MRYLTVKEVAEVLRVTPYTVRKWIRQGKLFASKTGKEYRIHNGHVQGFINKGYKNEKE